MTFIHELLGTVRTTRDWLLTQPRDPAAARLCAELTQRLVEADWERAHQWELTPDREGHLCPHCGAYISLSAMGDDQDEAELQPCVPCVPPAP